MSDKIYRFTASWCQPCKMLARYLEDAKLDVPVEVVDIDVHPEFAQENLIRSVPTLIYMHGGKEVARRVGMSNTSEIEKWAQEAAQQAA